MLRALVVCTLTALVASATTVVAIESGELNGPIQLEGQWDDAEYGALTWTAALRMNGTAFSGVVELPDAAGAAPLVVEGTRVGNEVTFRIVRSDRQLGSFEGKVEGTQLIGSYVDAKGGAKAWSGAWRPESVRVDRDASPAE